jgi:hypothetical protein
MIEAINFLTVLELTADARYQIFHDKKASEMKAKSLSGSFSELEQDLRSYNIQGYAICVQVNGSEQRKGNRLERVRWHYADFDNVDQIPELPFEPHMIVKTKRGFHVYWRIEISDNLNLWDRVQKALVCFIGADSGVSSMNQVLRVPGFDHHKGEPYTVSIYSWDATQRDYTDSELAKILNVPLTLPLEARLDYSVGLKMTVSTRAQRILFPIVKSELNKQLQKIHHAKEGSRYKAVRSAAFCCGSYIHWGLDQKLAFSSLRKAVSERKWKDDDLNISLLENLIRKSIQAGYAKGSPSLTEGVKQELDRIELQEETARKIFDQSVHWPDQVTTSDIKRIVEASGIDAESCWGGKAYGHALVKIVSKSGYGKWRKSNGIQYFQRAPISPKAPVYGDGILIRDSTA